jgi:hypothetical protein
MQHQLILVVGVLLSSCLSAEAQTPFATQVFLPQARSEPTVAVLPAPPAHLLPTAFQSVQLYTRPVTHLSDFLNAAHNPDRSLIRLSPVESNKTMFVSQSLLPLVQFWSGRLQLGASISTLHMENFIVSLGHLGSSHSVDHYGVRLAFQFGRGAQTRGTTQAWRRMTQLVGAILY